MKKILIIILLGILMTSCQTGKVVYNIGNGWKPAPQTSTMTGWGLKTK